MKRLLLYAFALLLPLQLSAYTIKRVSVHDPSIVWEPTKKLYYIFGSHRAAAKSSNLIYWNAFVAPWATSNSNNADNNAAFVTQQVTSVTKGGQTVSMPAFDAQAWSAAYGGYSVDGNMWAPDVFWNKVMQKWCMYLSINGPHWNSSIILLTADKIEGPYRYQAPVIISGFNVGSEAAISYKKTDLELAIGTQASLPARYAVGNGWGRRWPHAIDPCVFYDEEGKLWMTYGSWSGGIWILELDEQTGLRDYDVKYSVQGSGDGVTSDPYFGKKIGGGYYVSGEASYVEYINGYYYLFITYGGLTVGGNPNDYNAGGYQMRVFRSREPDGPYKGPNNLDAIFTSYALNFGASATTDRGENILGAYGEWGNQVKGSYDERSQGHNSILAAEDGRTYLVYHTRFQNRGEGHEVRVHQVFQNEYGWLVAAPFEYTGEQVTSADIATTQQVATSQIHGKYYVLVHKNRLDHTKKELVTPVEVELHGDGTISGDLTGKWTINEGTSYINLTLGGTTYRGVMVNQTMEPKATTVEAFTAMANSGVTVWGYKFAETSGINDITADDDRPLGPVYDLQGRRATNLQPGRFYIQDGRKFIYRRY